MMPLAEFPPGIPFTSHTIVALLGAQKDAVNVCDCPSASVAAEGVSKIGFAQVIVTAALPDFVESAVLVAVTVTEAGEGTAAGAI